MEVIRELKHSNERFKNMMLEVFLVGLDKFEMKEDRFKGEIEKIASDIYFSSLPNLTLTSKGIFCDDDFLDLSKSQLILKVFECFMNTKNRELSREELIRLVYNKSFPEGMSDRKIISLEHNTVKLVSRARSLACESFPNVDREKFEWFYYNTSLKKWILLKKR